MRHARRLIATIVGAALWCVAVTTVAYAQLPPDPVGGGDPGPIIKGPTTPVPADTSTWNFVLVAVIAALLTVAVVGLIASLRHSRSERPSSMLQA